MKLRRRPEAENIADFVEVFGVDDAFKVILEMGGSEIYLPGKTSERSMLARLVGPEKVMALSKHLGFDGAGGYIRIPVGRRFLARVMKDRGASHNEIARTVRADIMTVRKWFNQQAA